MKNYALSLATLLPLAVWGMDDEPQNKKSLKLPLFTIPKLTPATTERIVAVVERGNVPEGGILRDSDLRRCFFLDESMDLHYGNLQFDIAVDSAGVVEIVSPELSKAERREFVKTIILGEVKASQSGVIGERTLSNSSLAILAGRQQFEEAYEFLSIYFLHSASLAEEMTALTEKLPPTISSIAELQRKVDSLSCTAPHLQSILAFIPPVEARDSAQFLVSKKRIINSERRHNIKLFEAIFENNFQKFEAALSAIIDQLVAIICDQAHDYREEVIHRCQQSLPAEHQALHHNRSCCLIF